MTLPALLAITEKLQALLTYDASSPLIFSSGLFLFLFAGFMLVYSMFRLFFRSTLRCDPKGALPFFCISSKRWIRLVVDQVQKLCLQHGFTNAEESDLAVIQCSVDHALQKRNHALLKHTLHLPRRSRHADNIFPVFF